MESVSLPVVRFDGIALRALQTESGRVRRADRGGMLAQIAHAGRPFAQAPDESVPARRDHSACGSVKKKEPELADTRVPILRLSTLSGGDL